MRTASWALLAAAAAAALSALFTVVPRSARAATTLAQALEDANAALGADPPERDAALARLRAAIPTSTEPEGSAQAYLLCGALEEERGDYEAALQDYRAVPPAPATRWTVRASDRVDWLRARSEGDFEPLRRLEHVRRDPRLATDAAAIDALAREAGSFPRGRVRVEARIFVAEAYLGRLRRPDDAVAQLREVTADPEADPLSVRLAERELVEALANGGRPGDAAAEARAHAVWLDPAFATHLARVARRGTLRLVACGVLAAFGLLAGGALARAKRVGVDPAAGAAGLRLLPLPLAFVAFVSLAGGALAAGYERGNATPFLLLGGTALPLLLLARAWSAIGSATRSAIVLRALLSGASVVAAAFLVLDRLSPSYLDGFGL